MADKEVVESEIKLRMRDPVAARQALSHLGARLVAPRHFEDNVLFDDASSSLRSTGRLLRVRRTPGGAVLTFKGPGRIIQGVKSRPELETSFQDADAFEAILAGLGFSPFFRYQKYRETYAWNDLEIVVDETPIGTFLEIEGRIEGIHEAASALGRGPGDYIAQSYAALFFASGGKGDMVFS